MTLELVFLAVAGLLGLASTCAVVVAMVRDHPSSEAFRYEVGKDAAPALVKALADSERRVKVVGGELSAFAWPQVAEALLENLRTKSSYEVRILGGPRIRPLPEGNHATYDEWKRTTGEFDGRFQMRFSKHAEQQHFSVVDGRLLAVEDRHGPGEPRTGRVYRRAYFAPGRFERRFEELWRTVDTVSEPELEPCDCEQILRDGQR